MRKDESPRLRSIRLDPWIIVSIAVTAAYALFLLYPLIALLSKSVIGKSGGASLEYFTSIFTKAYYGRAIMNSFKVTLAVTAFSVLLATPLAYLTAVYKIRGRAALEILILVSSMSAPFIGAYSWIQLFGRSGAVTQFVKTAIGWRMPDIYGFPGIVLVMSLQLYSLVFMFVSGAFKSMDNSLIEACESLGCTGIRKFARIVLPLLLPTLLAGALMVFMRTFADYGTPALIGEGYTTLPVLVYKTFMSETGSNDSLAAAISVIAVFVTTAVFLLQKFVVNRKKFTMNALHPIHAKSLKGAANVFAHLYCYIVVALAMLPQLYVIFSSFRKTSGKLFVPGFSLASYITAFNTVGKTITNTYLLGFAAIICIVVIASLVAYVVVRRPNPLNTALDVITMFPETVAGSILGIALLISFSKRPLLFSGTAFIMILSYTIRRLPYTVRSSSAILSQISPSIEEASISLGASGAKTFARVTLPMMMPGVISGAILSWIMIITELSTSIILYSTRTKTMTLEIYSQIIRGNDGIAAAISSILTFSTIIALVIFFKVSGKKEIEI
ncbi:MAG: iron ABC transporter permease [Oscillospiraceae bacterium]|jgi:iron(III) transport system permease protein|nr:iron ABC transporter permease [Oscillospiraceae bacterium]